MQGIMPDEVSIIRNEWMMRRTVASVKSIHLIKSTSKGIIPLIPWSLTKEINIKSIINTLMLFFTVKIVSFSQEAAEWTI